MNIFKSKKLALITIVYWFLLVYVIAALVWWFISLEKLNQQMTDLKIQELRLDDPYYNSKSAKIYDEERRKTAQYIGEGVTFLALILIAAVFIYRATRNQFRLSLQQQNFMMAITHELKTPIAVTRLNLETLQKRKLEEAQQQKLISNSLQETVRLNDLCSNILLASQLEAGSYHLTRRQVDLSMLAEESVNEFKNRFPQRVIVATIEDNILIQGEELLLQLLINNLIENALKYTPKDKLIKVVLESHSHKIYLQVIDEGPGIEEREKKKIFEKFYRIGNESTRSAKGTGLGLYLVKRIAHDHKAHVSVTDNNTNGSIFTVIFKR